jgi:hypothetical protein
MRMSGLVYVLGGAILGGWDNLHWEHTNAHSKWDVPYQPGILLGGAAIAASVLIFVGLCVLYADFSTRKR